MRHAVLVACVLAAPAQADPPPTVVALREARAAEQRTRAAVVPKTQLRSDKLEVGQTGVLQAEEKLFVSEKLLIDRIHGPDSATIRVERTSTLGTSAGGFGGSNAEGRFGVRPAGPAKVLASVYILLKGHPTKGLADDKPIALTGTFKVTGTEKLDGQTLFVLEAAREEDLKRAKAAAALDAAEVKVARALKARNAAAAKAWATMTVDAAKQAKAAKPVPTAGPIQERVKAQAAQDRAVTAAVKAAREQLAAEYELTPQEAKEIAPDK